MERRAKGKVHRKKAAALKYDPATSAAPRVVAAGGGVVAEQIIARARAAGVPVQEDPLLVDCLCRVPLGGEIPPELYQAVAEVLAFIFRLEGDAGGAIIPPMREN